GAGRTGRGGPDDGDPRPAPPSGEGLSQGGHRGRADRCGARGRERAPMTAIHLADIGDTFAVTVTTGPIVFALGAAMLTGLVSFASPCVVPLVPGYLSYLAGLVGAEAPAVAV